LRGFHENQQKILEYLLDHPQGGTLEELSAHLGITKTATKEHVIKLETAGYLTFKDIRGAVGRPRRSYLITPEGQETFPRKYSWLSNALLELLADDLGEDAVQKIMSNLAKKVATSMKDQLQNAGSTAELLELIAQTMNDLGYRTALKQADLRKGAVLEATNCVYHEVAKKHPSLCTFDVQFIKHATGGMQVRLESCIARGGSVCRFCVRRPPNSK
jgi:predicted ArsR family transcriptional regulator